MNLLLASLAACEPTPCPQWFVDADADGYGQAPTVASCAVRPGEVANGEDCDDQADDVHPAATEACNGRDDDCDGAIDPPATPLYVDLDGDGWGGAEVADPSCIEDLPSGVVREGGDCDDSWAAVSPGATEVCNGVDDDCDEIVDEQGAVPGLGGELWWRDADGDGLGDPDVRTVWCADPGAEWVGNFSDCDDADPDAVCPPPAPAGDPRTVDEIPDRIIGAGQAFPLEVAAVGNVLAVQAADAPGLSLFGPDHGAVGRADAVASYAGQPTFAVGAGDVDGDGRDDLLLGLEDAAAVFRAPFAGTLAQSDAALTVLADFGWFEGATPAGDGAIWLVDFDHLAHLVDGAQAGTVALADASAAAVEVPFFAELASGDLDGDGLDELVVADWSATVELQHVGAVWVVAPPFDGTVAAADAARSLLCGVDFFNHVETAVAGVDVDGDGREDLLAQTVSGPVLVTDVPAGTALIHGLPGTVFLGSVSSARFAGDLDGDGAADLAFTDVDLDGVDFRPTVRVAHGPFAGTEDVGELEAWGGPVDGDPLEVAAGDFDGDGVSELALGSLDLGMVYVGGAP